MGEEKKIGITAMVLTYNEQDRIRDVLSCLKSFDDIIILDKSSTDNTRTIALEYGAKIIQVPYYNDSTPSAVKRYIKEKLYEIQNNEWIFGITSSDIVHHKLYENMIEFLENNMSNNYVIDVPLYRYSMGIKGKHTYYGEKEYIGDLWHRDMFNDKECLVHEDPWENVKKAKLECEEGVGIYHLTHAKLSLIMDRHWRYAVQYVEDYTKEGKTRKEIMKYAVKESLKMYIQLLTRRIYKNKWEGLSQCMMLVMYNAMIYLNAYFSEEKEKEICDKYTDIRNICRGD
ncbi:glycosyltransferase [Eisenbergiella tayi]|uniref:glycosyltransferase n=1 Tax=Eisenbergiella tayi TaxID=1432052 RepID=UPI0008485E00|nr:glycosyltransferase [Eisenbergiella tayi]ODR36034.1 hypothetical protein BEI60_15510 [Eisenbergiella tayi]